ISGFIKEGIVAGESTRIKFQGKRRGSSSSSLIIPPRPVPQIPPGFRTSRRSKSHTKIDVIETTIEGEEIPMERGDLIWSRDKLPASSVQIPNSSNTSPTGGLRLVQGGFRIDGSKINQTTYFRQIIFRSADWRQISTNPYVEVATLTFFITVKGEY